MTKQTLTSLILHAIVLAGVIHIGKELFSYQMSAVLAVSYCFGIWVAKK